MIYLLLGNDDFTKKGFLDGLLAKEKLEVVTLFEGDGVAKLVQAANDSNLFGGKKLVRAYEFFAKNLVDLGLLESMAKTSNIIVFIEEKLDKRKTETKKLLAEKNLKVLEFNTPAGLEFKNWLNAKIKDYDLKLSGKALDLFLLRIGFGVGDFGPPLYTLWQVDSELRKLSTFAGESPLTEKDIENLISENLEENVFAITNALGDRNQGAMVKAVTDYLDKLPGDEKAKVISLSALLAEQFRSILIIQDLSKQDISESEMSSLTGFTSGKLFVYKKLSGNFSNEKLRQALNRLEVLDQEVKTSTGPATLQMLMILNQV
jgi:DNA polymerase-3 subunit delta